MERQYLIDTNTAIDFLDDKLPDATNKLIEQIDSQISIVTRIELLGWNIAVNQQLQTLTNFITASFVHDLDETVVLKTIELRRNYKIKLPDAIIAATALVYNLTLISRNSKDFSSINDLKTINPYQFP